MYKSEEIHGPLDRRGFTNAQNSIKSKFLFQFKGKQEFKGPPKIIIMQVKSIVNNTNKNH